MENLAAYLFGNVNEEGQLEDSGLDEEVRESLQKVAVGDVVNQIFSDQTLGFDEQQVSTKKNKPTLQIAPLPPPPLLFTIEPKTLYPAFEKDKVLKFSELFATKCTRKKLRDIKKYVEPVSLEFDIDERQLVESSSSKLFEDLIADGSNTTEEELAKYFPSFSDDDESMEYDNNIDNNDSDSYDSKPFDDPGSIIGYRNLELESGEWINNILWDNRNIDNDASPLYSRLILDMNDPNILFEQPGEDKIIKIHKYKTSDDNKENYLQYNVENVERRNCRKRLNFGQMFIRHSLPALKLHPQYFKTKFTKSEIRALHRPTIQVPVGEVVHFRKIRRHHRKNKRKLRSKHEKMKRPKDLSLKDNEEFVLLEYSEEYPPILSNIGMGSLLLNYYRKIDSNDTYIPANIFVVGQTFPMQEVPSPPSRKAKATIAARIQATALRLMKRNRYHIVTHDQLLKRFPDYKEDTIRSRMKVAELVRKKGTDNNIQIWKLKPSRGVPSEKEIRKILNESQRALKESKLAVEEQLAPWITTRNFLNATQSNAMLKLHGEGDPTGKGEGFSFIRISMKDIFLKAGESAKDKLEDSTSFIDQSRYNNDLSDMFVDQQDINNEDNEDNEDNQVDSDVDMENVEMNDLMESAMPDQTQSPESMMDYDDITSVDGSITSRTNYDCSSHRNRALVINRSIRSDNGEKRWTKEYITDPSVINAYIRQRQVIEEQTLNTETLEPTNDEERNERLKKRIQDQLARLKRNQERRQQRLAVREAKKAAKLSAAGNVTSASSIVKEKKTETTRRCGNCGALGHMKTNKKCPLYNSNNIPSESSTTTVPTTNRIIIKINKNTT
ncbi:2689_t:CDS:10 [Entrophospora sp. SA101]|nr:6262_t:CDS:10 [Entrophospora sp. SA101]CAJ0830914.1 2689_t:CDS:10 [Entrophospora sp. SA101]